MSNSTVRRILELRSPLGSDGSAPTRVKFEFVGKVESINIKGDGTSGYQFLFSLINKKAENRSFLLDPSDPLRLSAMASLLTAAFATKKKVSIRTAANASGPAFAGELEVRTKN